jgi:hypothetical protein
MAATASLHAFSFSLRRARIVDRVLKYLALKGFVDGCIIIEEALSGGV